MINLNSSNHSTKKSDLNISIVGLGWFGKPLALSLRKDGYKISGTTRNPAKITEDIHVETLNYPETPSAQMLNGDIVVLNIPPFDGQLEWFKKWPWNKKTWCIFISSTSTKEVLIEEENWVKEHFESWTIIRFAGLLGNGRHPGKHLSGRKNLPGKLWPVNLIHLDDTVKFTKLVIQNNLKSETYTLVSNDHPARQKFYTDYCLKNGLPVPEFDENDLSVKVPIDGPQAAQLLRTFSPIK